MNEARVSHKLEDSLGPDLGTFASYQGAIHDVMRVGKWIWGRWGGQPRAARARQRC
jgi:hypothetical protein